MRAVKPSFAFLTGAFIAACGSSGDINERGTHINGAGGGAASSGTGASAGNDGDGGPSTGGFGQNRNSGGTAGRNGQGGGSGSGTSGNAGRGGGSGSNNGGGAGTNGGGITNVTPVPAGQGCATETLEATGQILDIFIMQDRSGSMDDCTTTAPDNCNDQSPDTKWKLVTGAINGFVADPKSAGVGAGIGFFGDGTDDPSCNAADYATPAVGIAPLNGNAQAITGAIAGMGPNGRTPTEPAVQGALNYARSWAQRNPTHKVVVVLATDGAPNGCSSDPDGVAAIAATGVSGTPPIPTYVIGVIGTGNDNDGNCPNGPTQNCQFVQALNTMAKGGGTGSAFIVNTSGNTQQQFQDAMNAIRNANGVGCIFNIPPAPSGRVVDLTKATVQYTPGAGAAQSLPWATNQSTCAGSWYYDSVTNPTNIHVCPGICATINADSQARVDVIVGCKTNTPGAGGAPGAGGTPNAGGAAGAAGRAGSGGYQCLLTGQSCQTGADCCSGMCTGGVCVTLH